LPELRFLARKETIWQPCLQRSLLEDKYSNFFPQKSIFESLKTRAATQGWCLLPSRWRNYLVCDKLRPTITLA
jgi:hypothetical protein